MAQANVHERAGIRALWILSVPAPCHALSVFFITPFLLRRSLASECYRIVGRLVKAGTMSLSEIKGIDSAAKWAGLQSGRFCDLDFPDTAGFPGGR